MAGKERAVLGIYANYSSVENAVEVLKEAGFRNGDISVLFPQRAGSKDFAHTKGTRVPEGAAAGAGTGALLGGALGWLVGIGTLAIPGLGPFIAAGPIMARRGCSRRDNGRADWHGNSRAPSQTL